MDGAWLSIRHWRQASRSSPPMRSVPVSTTYENGINGVTVKAGDVDELYGALQTFAQNPELVQEWGMKSREMSHALTPEAGAEKWVQVFETMAAR